MKLIDFFEHHLAEETHKACIEGVRKLTSEHDWVVYIFFTYVVYLKNPNDTSKIHSECRKINKIDADII